jgi:uncharacterized membrane protein YvbJ
MTTHKHEHPKAEHAIFHCDKCTEKFHDIKSLKEHQAIHSDVMENLRKEIVHEVEAQDKKRISWGSSLITIALVVLTLFSVAQTVLSANILDKVTKNQIKGSSTGGSVAPTSLDSLPKMVGGC